MGHVTKRHISQRELKLPEAVIGKLLSIAAERKDVISLGPGEPDFPLPAPIANFIKRGKLERYNHYSAPAGRTDLRKAIASKLKRENKLKVDWDQVVVGCGSQEVLFSSLLSAIDPGDQVIIQDPGYMAYVPNIKLASGKPVSLELREEENWMVNPDRLEKLARNKRAKVFILNSPANPTGNVLSKKVLEEIADVAVDNDLYVFSDEAYEKLVYSKKHISIGSLNGMENHIVTFQTFSKAYSMTGFRIGYAAGPRKFMDALSEAHHNVSLCAPHISQVVAKFALSIDKKYINKMVKEYDRRRKFIVRRLNEIGLKTIEPFGAFYTFSNIKGVTRMNSFNFADKLLRKAKLAMVPGSEFGKFGEGYIRCSYATEYKLIGKAMDKLEKFVRK